ncbi:unnamed protein product [Eretmochelys imbricata]
MSPAGQPSLQPGPVLLPAPSSNMVSGRGTSPAQPGLTPSPLQLSLQQSWAAHHAGRAHDAVLRRGPSMHPRSPRRVCNHKALHMPGRRAAGDKRLCVKPKAEDRPGPSFDFKHRPQLFQLLRLSPGFLKNDPG